MVNKISFYLVNINIMNIKVSRKLNKTNIHIIVYFIIKNNKFRNYQKCKKKIILIICLNLHNIILLMFIFN